MLILTRRVGEAIVVGDNVLITILGTKRNQVRIGVQAPKDIVVHRQEVYARIRQERERAADDESVHKELGNADRGDSR